MGYATSTSLVVSLLCLLFASVKGNILTGTSFPWEPCRQTESMYSARLAFYNVATNVNGIPISSTMCFTITSKGKARCYQEYGVAKGLNTTQCCDAGFTKFKFWPSQSCRHSIQSATLQVGGSNVAAAQSWTSQYMDTSYYNPNYGGIQFVMKLTGLGMDSITANGAQICMTLNSECPTLQAYSFDPARFEYMLYNVKTDWSAGYECCNPGLLQPIPSTSCVIGSTTSPCPGSDPGAPYPPLDYTPPPPPPPPVVLASSPPPPSPPPPLPPPPSPPPPPPPPPPSPHPPPSKLSPPPVLRPPPPSKSSPPPVLRPPSPHPAKSPPPRPPTPSPPSPPSPPPRPAACSFCMSLSASSSSTVKPSYNTCEFAVKQLNKQYANQTVTPFSDLTCTNYITSTFAVCSTIKSSGIEFVCSDLASPKGAGSLLGAFGWNSNQRCGITVFSSSRVCGCSSSYIYSC